MPGPMDYATYILSQNPRIQSTPQSQQLMQMLQNHDIQGIKQIATNICQVYGTTTQDALNQAKQYFHIPF